MNVNCPFRAHCRNLTYISIVVSRGHGPRRIAFIAHAGEHILHLLQLLLHRLRGQLDAVRRCGRDAVVLEQPGKQLRMGVGDAAFGVEHLFEGVAKFLGSDGSVAAAVADPACPRRQSSTSTIFSVQRFDIPRFEEFL